jgi:hypothetical protein
LAGKDCATVGAANASSAAPATAARIGRRREARLDVQNEIRSGDRIEDPTQAH